MWANWADGTEQSAVQVNMCAGTCKLQSHLSHARIVDDCRAPNRSVWNLKKLWIPGEKMTRPGEKSGFIPEKEVITRWTWLWTVVCVSRYFGQTLAHWVSVSLSRVLHSGRLKLVPFLSYEDKLALTRSHSYSSATLCILKLYIFDRVVAPLWCRRSVTKNVGCTHRL